MAYSTPAMVRQALVPSSDGSLPNPPSNTGADLSDQQLIDAIAEADALIDANIGGFYAVPVAPVILGNDDGDGSPAGSIPHPVDYWSRTIAAYLATCTYRQSLDFTDNDPVARRYKDTMAALSAVSQGKLKLQIPQNTGPNAAAGAGQAFNPYVGDLWTPDDFSLTTGDVDQPGSPFWYTRW